MSRPTHYVFDAYGTLFDVHSAAARHKEEVGPQWERLSQLWRTKHLEYTWIHACAGRHAPFWQLASESLDYAIEICGGVPAGVRDKLMAAYRTLSAYPEVPAVLAALRTAGVHVSILTNGDPDMIADAVSASQLSDTLDAVITVHEAGIYKPSPKVYALVTDRFGIRPGAVSFQSSNRWDVAGATAFGFGTVWINRTGMPDEYPGLPAGRTLRDLSGLVNAGAPH